MTLITPMVFFPLLLLQLTLASPSLYGQFRHPVRMPPPFCSHFNTRHWYSILHVCEEYNHRTILFDYTHDRGLELKMSCNGDFSVFRNAHLANTKCRDVHLTHASLNKIGMYSPDILRLLYAKLG